MPDVIDLKGHVFGPWVVLGRTARPYGNKTQGAFWSCRCQCGHLESIPGARLRAGRFSKGCVFCRSHGATAGGMTPEYQSWRGMRERCINLNHASFRNYGGRGIKVCDRWLYSFPNFLKDMGKRPKGASLDRINCDGDYEPSNCRWADAATQSRNRRDSRLCDEQVAAIMRLLDSGARQIDVAQAVGIARGYVANIATARTSPKAAEIRRIRQDAA